MVGPVWCCAFRVLPRPSLLALVVGCGEDGVLRVWLPVLPCCGPLVAVVGGCFACSGGVPRGWCALLRLVGACHLLCRVGWPLVPSNCGPHGRRHPSLFFRRLLLVSDAGCCALAGGPCSVRSPVVGGLPFPRRGGRCYPAWGGLLSGLEVATWLLWFVFAGWSVSPGWARWSPGFTAVGFLVASLDGVFFRLR